jgi:hypothetical protein
MVYAIPAGRAVRDELALLLPGMDERRRAGIAFLECDGRRQSEYPPSQPTQAAQPGLAAGGAPADDMQAQTPPPDDPLLATRVELDASDVLEHMILGTTTARQAPNVRRQPLTTLVVEALRGQHMEIGWPLAAGANPRNHADQATGARPGVLDEKVIQRITEDGYTVPNAQVVVWIVASPQFVRLADVVRDVRRALRLERVSARVILVLPNAYSADVATRERQEGDAHRQPWQELLGSGAQQAPQGTASIRLGALADFAFLFETRDERGFYWSAQDGAFAIAEMIFTLMTTGIMGAPDVDQVLRNSVPHNRIMPFERMGGAGTSRLTFPRAYIELYSASHLAQRIAEAWAAKSAEMTPKVPGELVSKQQQAAKSWVARMRGLQGPETKSTTEVVKSLARARTAEVQRIKLEFDKDLDNRLVFNYFASATLAELEEKNGDLGAVLRNQRARAESAFRLWRANIKRYWREYEREQLEDLNRRTANDVLMGAGGADQLYAFFVTLDQELASAKVVLESERKQRETQYRAMLEHYNNLSREGAWMGWVAHRNVETNDPNQAIRPGPMPAQRLDPSRGILDAANAQQGQPVHDPNAAPLSLLSLEDQIIEQLAARYRYNQGQWGTLTTTLAPTNVAPIAVLGTPPLVMLLVALLSGAITALATPLGIVLLAAVSFAFLLVSARISLPQPLARPSDSSRADLIEFQRRLLGYDMRVAEDEQRESLLIGLHAEVRDSLGRLANWSAFVQELGGQLNQQANGIESRLFNGSIGRRDICVANRRVLHPTRYGLNALDHDLTRRREDHPRQTWHANEGQIAKYVLDRAFQGVSLVRSSPERIRAILLTACREIVGDYLDGDVASISAALRAMPQNDQAGLLNQLASRALILYRPDTPPSFEPLLFVCARDQDRLFLKESDLTNNATMARILDTDWLGMIRITHGSGAPDFWGIHSVNGVLPPGLPQRPTWGPVPANGTNGTNGANGFTPPQAPNQPGA